MSDSRPPEVKNVTEYPALGETTRPYVPAKTLNSSYPLIDSDPHFRRVISYFRPSDYAVGAACLSGGPALMLWWERVSPSGASRASFMSVMRLSGGISFVAGFLLAYQRSLFRFYGVRENRREMDRDMREMVDKVKKGEPLYGVSTMTEYMQGVASRQSRYSGFFFHVLPWFNFVNHVHHGVDTAKYYQQAERELEEERTGEKMT